MATGSRGKVGGGWQIHDGGGVGRMTKEALRAAMVEEVGEGWRQEGSLE